MVKKGKDLLQHYHNRRLWFPLILALMLAPASWAQNLDSLVSYFEVDQLPRSDSVSSPAIAFDRADNFTVVWLASDKGLAKILARRFDAIGRPLTEITTIVADRDSERVSNPHLCQTTDGQIWIAWQRAGLRERTEAVAQIFQENLKPISNPFLLDETAKVSTSKPRLANDSNGRVVAVWEAREFPVHVLARIFKGTGEPETQPLLIDTNLQMLQIKGNVQVATSSAGLIAVTWNSTEEIDHIYIRFLDAQGNFLTDPVEVASRNVAFPTLDFSSPDEVVMQWYASDVSAPLRAQKLDRNGKTVGDLVLVAAGDPGLSPAVVVSGENGRFVSFWSEVDTRDRQFRTIYARIFGTNGRPITPPWPALRTPDNTQSGTELDATFTYSKNLSLVYAGNDSVTNSPSPRIGVMLTRYFLPDLEISNLSLSPEKPTRADSVKVTFEVVNSGPAPAAASSALVRLDQTSPAKTIPTPALLPGEAVTLSTNLGTIAPGSFTLVIAADQAQEISETDEKNNVLTQSLEVSEGASLLVNTNLLQFTGVLGLPILGAEFLTLSNVGTGTLGWSATVDAPWVRLSPSSGTITNEPVQLSVSVDVLNLLVGLHSANITFESNGGRAGVRVSLTITAPVPTMLVQPLQLSFAATQGDVDPPPQSFSILNIGTGEFSWQLIPNQNWLQVLPAQGTTSSDTDEVFVSVSAGDLAPGEYQGAVLVQASVTELRVSVTLTVSALPPALQVSPTSLSFAATEGSADPLPQSIFIRNAGGGTLSWTVSESVPWLSPSDEAGTSTGEEDTLLIYAQTVSLVSNTYSATLDVASNGGSQPVRVSFTVNPATPILAVNRRTLDFGSSPPGATLPSQSIVVRNVGNGALSWTATSDQGWLLLNPSQGESRGEADSILATVVTEGLPEGDYTAIVRINSFGGNEQIAATLRITSLADLRVQLSAANLDSCYAADFIYSAAFRIENAGQTQAPASVARLLIGESLRQQLDVPALPPFSFFDAIFSGEILQSGSNFIQCEIDVSQSVTEGDENNNALSFEEWVPERGDVDTNRVVNLTDLFLLVDYILQRPIEAGWSERSCWAANAVVDSTLDLSDLLAVVDRLLAEESQNDEASFAGKLEVQIENIAGGKTRMHWNSTIAVRGIQGEWHLSQPTRDEPRRTLRAGSHEVEWKIARNTLKFLVWSRELREINPATTYSFELPGQPAIESLHEVLALSNDGKLVRLAVEILNKGAELPREFSVSPAFPNPVRRSQGEMVQWRYDLPARSQVQIKIYNLLGQEVKQFALAPAEAGRYELSWDTRSELGRRLADGIYFMEFRAREFVKRERLILH